MRPKVSSADPGSGPSLFARSKWVTPRSTARSTIARDSSNGSTLPKLCHSPRETMGRRMPLRPQRRYVIASYRLGVVIHFLRKGALNLSHSIPVASGAARCAGREPSSLDQNLTMKSSGPGQYASVNGLELYYEMHGEPHGKPPLVLLHGGVGGIAMFGPNLGTLAQGRRIIAVELQGHGRT